jgi:serine protease inhibitor
VKRAGMVGLCAVCLCLTSCSSEQEASRDITPYNLNSTEEVAVRSINDSGFRVFGELASMNQQQNIVMSPVGLCMALGMTLSGAEGATQEAIRVALGLRDLSGDQATVDYAALATLATGPRDGIQTGVANSIWYREQLRIQPDFINLCQTRFGAAVRGVDFSSPDIVDTINSWVNKETVGVIQKILSQPIDPQVVVYLLSAVHFQGAWQHKFDVSLTKDADFHLPGGSTSRCRMMENEHTYRVFRTPDFKVKAVDLPYGDGSMSMVVMLPYSQSYLDTLIAGLNADRWSSWLENFIVLREPITVYLPRFKGEYDGILNEALTREGMGMAFAPGADFSRMASAEELWISEIEHVASVTVDEEGTQAAAATKVEMTIGLANVLRIDRPFIFMIRDTRTGVILFLGRIVVPGYWE